MRMNASDPVVHQEVLNTSDEAAHLGTCPRTCSVMRKTREERLDEAWDDLGNTLRDMGEGNDVDSWGYVTH